jgi:Mrp family chromosome partitioning ATPase
MTDAMDQARTLRRLADDARQYQLQTLWPGQADRSGPCADQSSSYTDQSGLYPAHAYPGVKVLSFTSGKGGVGKTHIVVNLAYALQSLGARVMLLDADLGLANVDVLLGLAPRSPSRMCSKGTRRWTTCWSLVLPAC